MDSQPEETILPQQARSRSQVNNKLEDLAPARLSHLAAARVARTNEARRSHFSEDVKNLPVSLSDWECVFLTVENRLRYVFNNIRHFRERHDILPKPSQVFNMFRMIRPDRVKVVMIGQSPYPGCCPTTNIPYAYGPAFLPNPMCATTPVTLRNIVIELCRDMRVSHLNMPPKKLIADWIDEGVMLLNASMTLGVRCPRYLEDHSVLWEEAMRSMVRTIATVCNDPVFVLIGRDAWKLEECIASGLVIRVSHPVARAKSAAPWIGSGVFSAVSTMMLERGIAPIKWIK